MRRYFWVDDRLSWWFVGFIVLIAAIWMALDIGWRTITMSITTLLGGWLLLTIILIVSYIWLWQRSASSHAST
jgi:hypothetical protein